MNSPRHALLIVEREFLNIHVGVRRVILHYWKFLLANGFEVTIGSPDGNGQLVRGFGEIVCESAVVESVLKPLWESTTRHFKFLEKQSSNESARIRWTDQLIKTSGYNVTFVTTPWLCSQRIPLTENIIGVAYDLVPNLLAIGALRLPNFIDVFSFAAQHDTGFRYFLANAKRVICISQSTKSDLVRFYPGLNGRVQVDVPFELQPSLFTKSETGVPTILMVNAIDHRKNIKTAIEVLIELRKTLEFRVVIVGKERMALAEAEAMFNRLSDNHVEVAWHGVVEDSKLHSLYAKSSVLFFPSIYEGLGLPILEAQAQGLPVVSSNTSSCGEFNLNKKLCAPPNDVTGFIHLLKEAIAKPSNILSGENLRQATKMAVKSWSNGDRLFAFDADITGKFNLQSRSV